MNKILVKLIILFVIISLAIFNHQSARASSIIIPGDTPEEVAINIEILESDDEYEVVTYLSNPASSVRMTACMRLQDIGTSFSIGPEYPIDPNSLLGLATAEGEEWEVRDEASFAVWMIRYREDISGGGNGEGVLLEILNSDGNTTKTPQVIGWAMQLLGDMGSEAALPLLQMIAHPYIPIASYGQLQGIQYNDLDGTYILIADINCAGESNFEPIDNFTGTFDGGGYTITNLYIHKPNKSNVGLFGFTNGAEIINVGLENVNITGYSAVGGLVGYAVNTNIEGVYSTGAVTTNEYYAGGLVGVLSSSNIYDSYSHADVTGSSDEVGGLVGYMEQSTNANLVNTYATGNVSGNNKVGGLVGETYSTGRIENSFATGSVTATTSYFKMVGGLIGLFGRDSESDPPYAQISATTVTGCYWYDSGGPDSPDNAYSYGGGGGGNDGCTSVDNEAYFYDASNSPMSGYWDFTNVWRELVGTYPILEVIIADTEITPFLRYLVEIAEISLIKINFITSYSTPEEAIEPGLVHDELCVRQWAIDALVKQDLDNLIERLSTLFLEAEGSNDSEFASYIAGTMQNVIEDMMTLPVEIEYPQDGAILKSPYIQILGYDNGEPFTELFELSPGENTYTKTVIDDDGNEVSESITIYYENEPPLLTPIGDKQILAGGSLTFTISSTDNDDTDLLYFAYNLPQEDAFDYETHTFIWTPQYTDVGTYPVTFATDDGWGLRDEEEITITVTNRYDLAIDFGSPYGIWTVSDDGSWSNITGISPKIMVAGNLNGDNSDELILDFGPSHGVWVRYNDGTWANISGITAKSIVTADTNNDKQDEVFIDFGSSYGIWKLENGNASLIHGLTSKSMIKADLDGNGADELVIDFGPSHGIWAIDGDGNLSSIHGLTSESMISADLDGNNKDELVIDFGPSYGIWTIDIDGTLSNIYPISPISMLTADLDSNNKDELIIVFDSGIWIRHDTGSWEHINGLLPESITAVDLDADNKDELVIDFGQTHGVWVRHYDGTWSHIYHMSPELITALELGE